MKKNLIYFAALVCCVLMFLVWYITGGDDSAAATSYVAGDAPYSEAASSPTPEPAAKMVNINFAPEEELALIPGVSARAARAIVEYREEHGYFKNIDELLDVYGIGEKTLEKIKDFIEIY